MKEMTVNEALQLVKVKPASAVSLYVGTNVSERDGVGKIKNNLLSLYKSVETALQNNQEPRRRERFLASLKAALSTLRLMRSRGGLAIYHSEDFTGVVKIPTPVRDLAVASDSFHLKPILRVAQLRRNYYVLALMKHCSKLIKVTADGSRELDHFNMSLKAERTPVFADPTRHWLRDSIKIRRQKDLRIAMTILNQRLQNMFQGERAPLLLAGSSQAQEAFRTVCSYPYLLPRGLEGQIDDLDFKAITLLSTSYMEPYFAELDLQVLTQFRRAEASGLGSTNLKQIAEGAARGRVQSLWIAEDQHVWGHLDRNTGKVQLAELRAKAPTDDLLDDIAELVILKGGRVTVLPTAEMPFKRSIAAIMRWQDFAPTSVPRENLDQAMGPKKAANGRVEIHSV